jgi:hypothetical protein
MKSSQQKKLSLVSNKGFCAGIIVMTVASLGMMCPVLAQQAPAPSQQPNPPPPTTPPPVPPPQLGGSAQLTSIRGTVSQYMLNPDGFVNGLLLSDNTIVRFPPHMSQQLG